MGNIHPLFLFSLILINLKWLLFAKFIVLKSYFYTTIKKTTIKLL